MTSSSFPDADRLVEHAAWMRRLARSLVGDAALADDLVQETWHAALVNPPPEDRPLRPWLAHVVRNFARRARRGESRRRRREEEGAQPEGQPSAAALVERLEGQRNVVDALLALEEPYRSTLVGRFFDELSAAEIARRTEVPEGTVRWRTKRGLELLRERLDASYGGDRGAWCVALLPWAVGRETAAVATGSAVATAGVLGMKALTLAVGAASAVLVAFLGWSALRSPEPPAQPLATPLAPVAVGAESTARSADAEGRGEAAAERAERQVLAGESASALAASPESVEAPAGKLHARFVDANGQPVVGVELRAEIDGEELLARSAANGVAELSVPLREGSEMVHFAATCVGHARHAATSKVTAGETTWLGDIELAFGGRIEGRVRDERGRPVAGAIVDATVAELPDTSALQNRLNGPLIGTLGLAVRTAADGNYELAGVPAGRVRVWAHTPATRFAFTAPVEIPARGVARGVDLQLEPLRDEDLIEGVVVDPAGRPVPDARVGYLYESRFRSGSSRAQLDADARFRVRMGMGGIYSFWAQDPERRYGMARVEDVAPGTRDLVLRLGELIERTLLVRDTRGEPIERFGVVVHGPDDEVWPPKPEEHPDGRAPLATPARPFYVTVAAAGYRSRTLGPLEAGSGGAAQLEELECVLDEAPGVRGRVLSVDGPVAGARVSLHESYPDGLLVLRNGFRMRFRQQGELEDVTDADGRFLLGLSSDAEFVLRAEAPGFAAAEWGPFHGPQAEIEVVLGRGGAIEGRVLVARGEDPTGTIVGIHCGDGAPRTRRVGPDGRFRFEGLTPGPWEVRRCEQEDTPGSVSTHHSANRDDEPWPWVCDVYAGETTFQDVDLRAGETCVLVGTLALGGESPHGWVASLWRRFTWGEQVRAGAPTCALAEDGGFRLEIEQPGAYTLRLEEAASGRSLTAPIKLATGERAWRFDYPVAELAGTGAHPVAGAELDYDHAFVVRASGVTLRVPLPAAADGTFHARGVPALPGHVVRWSPEVGASSPEGWDELVPVEPHPGSIERVALP